MPPAQRARRFPKQLRGLRSGPWVGCRDATDPAAADASLLRIMRNVVLEAGAERVRVTGRPGLRQMGAQLGAGGARAGQFIGQLTRQSGTTYTIAIVGGKVYTFDWSLRAWTNVVTAANLTTAGITLDASARVYAAYLADSIIFSDGINTPWQWDGSTGAGGLTKLTNAPIFYGQPWVYYAKLFGILASDHSAFAWSEENQPNVGYSATIAGRTYSNSWAPLGASAFTHGAATNEAMYVFQARRVIQITGAVNSDFQTSGTRSNVSESIGAVAAPLVLDDGVYFLDADYRPHVIQTAGGLVELYSDCVESLRALPRASLSRAKLEYDPALRSLFYGVPGSGQSSLTLWLVFTLAADGARYAGTWDGFIADTTGVVLDGSNNPVRAHLGVVDGFAYEHGTPDGELWDDALNAGTVPIAHQLTTSAVGIDIADEKAWERLDIITAAPTEMHLTVRATTPRGEGAAIAVATTGQGDRLDIDFILDSSTLAAAPAEVKQSIGWRLDGRWAEITIAHATAGERFGIVVLEPLAFATADDPTAP